MNGKNRVFVVNSLENVDGGEDYVLSKKHSKPTVIFEDKDIEISGMQFKVDLKKYTTKESFTANAQDENELLYMVELVIHSRNFQSYLRLTENSLNSFVGTNMWPASQYISTLSKYLEILKCIFTEESENNELFQHKFDLCGDTSQPVSCPKFVSKKSGPSKRRKIALNQTRDLNLSDSNLYLFLNILFQPSFLVDPVLLRFDFLTIQVLDIGPLPDEIMIVIFRFLPSRFLFQNVVHVQRRFHNLIESEYIYRVHHFGDLLRGIRVQMDKENTESWKEYTKRKFCKRVKWLPNCFDPEDAKYCKIDESGVRMSISDKYCYYGIPCLTNLEFELSESFDFTFAIHHADKITPDLLDTFEKAYAMVTVGFVPIRGRSTSEIAEACMDKCDFLLGLQDTYFGILSHGKWESMRNLPGNFYGGEGNYSLEKMKEEVQKLKSGEEIIVKMSLSNRVVSVEVKIGGSVFTSSFTPISIKEDEKMIVGATISYPLMFEIIN